MAIFGTDGIREISGQGIFQEENLKRLTHAIILWLNKKINSQTKLKDTPTILIGRDTRNSGKTIEKIIVSVLKQYNFTISILGIIPTQILAYFAKKNKSSLTIAITASHNPPEYNGIKLIENNGLKIAEKDEKEIENIYITLNTQRSNLNSYKSYGLVNKISTKTLLNDYINTVVKPISVKNCKIQRKVIVDCANGATGKIAYTIFRLAGFKNLSVINKETTGNNINVNCGVVNIKKIVNLLKQRKIDFDFLISFDGDGDRVYIVDRNVNILDGDALIAVYAYYHKIIKRDRLERVVGTIMSNSGLEKFCKKINIDFIRSAVGDRNVTLKIIENNTFLGGEPSGHIVNFKINSLGDGILNGLFFLKIFNENPDIIDRVFSIYRPYKNYLLNLKINKKIPIYNLVDFKNKIDRYNNDCYMNVRIVARYSGTENKLRILVESQNFKKSELIAKELRDIYLNNIVKYKE